MALSQSQINVLRIIAANRSPNSTFAGGSVANRSGPRISHDLDIEHMSSAAVAESFELDRKVLLKAGYTVEIARGVRPDSGFIEAIVAFDGNPVILDWTSDTAVRFFPAEEDPIFGWRLHDADIALNKLLALAGRRAPRDYYDVIRLHQMGFHLGTLAWAAIGKDAGMTPNLVLDECSRNTRYTTTELLREIRTEEPIDPVELKTCFLAAVNEARDWIDLMTVSLPDTVGCLVLDERWDLARLDLAVELPAAVTFHESTVGGALPVLKPATLALDPGQRFFP